MRIATYNVENLFSRVSAMKEIDRYRKNFPLHKSVRQPLQVAPSEQIHSR